MSIHIPKKEGIALTRRPLFTNKLRKYCAASRKVEGSIPNGVTGIFH